MSQSYYDLLGVSREATADEVKKAYKKAALVHHPDKGGDEEKFKECGKAVETLTDPSKRASYDSSLMRTRSRDGQRGSYMDRMASSDRAAAARASTTTASTAGAPTSSQSASDTRPPRPPPPSGPVEIPSDPSSLSAKELKELLTSLGIDHQHCLEKADFLELLKNRKDQNRAASKGAAGTPRESTTSRPSPSPAASSSTASAKSGHAMRVKLLSIGCAAVGKSCLIKRYCEGRFVQKYITTIGIDYGVKPIKVLGQDLKVNFFDTSGGNEFKDIRVEFYENSSGAMLVYDVTNRSSFTDLDGWLEEAKLNGCPMSKLQSSSQLPFVVLCANKVDLPRRTVTKAEGMQFANTHGMYYFETSAASGDSVVEAINHVFEKVVNYNLEARKRLGAG